MKRLRIDPEKKIKSDQRRYQDLWDRNDGYPTKKDGSSGKIQSLKFEH